MTTATNPQVERVRVTKEGEGGAAGLVVRHVVRVVSWGARDLVSSRSSFTPSSSTLVAAWTGIGKLPSSPLTLMRCTVEGPSQM